MSDINGVKYDVTSQECEWGNTFQALQDVEVFGKKFHKGDDIPYVTQQQFRVVRHLVEQGVVAKTKRR